MLESGGSSWGRGPNRYPEIRGFGGAECRHGSGSEMGV